MLIFLNVQVVYGFIDVILYPFIGIVVILDTKNSIETIPIWDTKYSEMENG